MIIEYVLSMWMDLYSAGYRATPPKPTPETWLEYLERAKRTVKEYREERRK